MHFLPFLVTSTPVLFFRIVRDQTIHHSLYENTTESKLKHLRYHKLNHLTLGFNALQVSHITRLPFERQTLFLVAHCSFQWVT